MCLEITDEDYYGDRKYGYGGYKYIPGRWKTVAEKLIKTYDLIQTQKGECWMWKRISP